MTDQLIFDSINYEWISEAKAVIVVAIIAPTRDWKRK